MKRTLSKPPHPFIFPSRAIGGFAGLAVGLFVLFRLQAATGWGWPLFAVAAFQVTIVVIAFMGDVTLRRDLKRVAVDDRFLYVVDDRGAEEVAIPLDHVVRVKQRRAKRLRPISIYLRSPSRFGSRIRFLPPPEFGWAWTEDRVVGELRKLAGLT